MRTQFVRRTLALTTAALLAAFGLQATADAAETSPAPLIGASDPNKVTDRYIVVLKSGATGEMSDKAENAAKAEGADVHFRYRSALQGFSATLSAKALTKVRANPNVKYVETDKRVSVDETQSPATWGIDRIDQRNLPLSNSYTYNYTGSGVTAYIIDTGVRFSHQQFGGRAVTGYDAIDGGSADDCHGHGTHVAGTVGSTTYGVAKQVRLVGVRVLNCSGSGTNAQVIAGIDWVTSDHAAGQNAVANMSLGGGVSQSLDDAVVRSINDGVTYALAAGNDNGGNACNGSPGRVGAAITVGSTTSTDARSSFSNIGTCLDIFAPGSSITSTWNSSDTATNTISGTSMATPHVAGAAALYLHQNSGHTPQQVRDAIVNSSTPNVVGNPGTGSPNRLLYSLFGDTPPPTGCAVLPERHSGTLSGTGVSQYWPGSAGWTAGAGTFRGCLDGPDGVDFDLYLQKRNSSGTWASVARGVTPDPDEDVSYNGTAGTYRWRVYAYSGSGAYSFGMNRP